MAKGKYERWLTEEGLLLIEGWARDGLTDDQIAHNMGITRKTLYEWKTKYSDICNTLKKGKEVVDILVENALLKRALGYDYVETSLVESEDGKKKKTVTRKHTEGNVTAQIFWLKNRKPDAWRAHPEPQYTEEYEDSGLIAALNASVDESMIDDIDMLPEDEDE